MLPTGIEPEHYHCGSLMLMRAAGIEPARSFDHEFLRLARLPFRHARVIYAARGI